MGAAAAGTPPGSPPPRHPSFAFPLGELDDQNGVLAGQADQDHEADASEDVDVHVRGGDASDGTEQAHRDDQDDGERQRPAFIQGGQDEEDHRHGEGEDDGAGIAGLEFQVGDLGPFVGHGAGQAAWATAA